MPDEKLSTFPFFRLFALLLIAASIVWHFYITQQIDPKLWTTNGVKLDSSVRVDFNPITNLVRLTMQSEPASGNVFDKIGEGLVKGIAPGALANMANVKARENYDVYAMLVPYAVTLEFEPTSPARIPEIDASGNVTAKPGATVDEQAKNRDERWQREIELQKAKNKERADYIADKLKMENFRVANGRTVFGKEGSCVYGTLVNNGSRTLKKVGVRVYFLDVDGKRIGEKDITPVLVTEISIGDNTPLRPGYRKDFGQSVVDDAPSGWALSAEAEIREIEFDEHG